jgi:tetratricopeptide (TPR) repeat protein
MNSSERRSELFTEAMSNFMKENFGVSIDLLNDILAEDHDDKLALMARGSTYLKMDNIQNAIEDYDRVILTDPNYAKAYHLRGLAREKAGDDENALDDFNQALTLDPQYGAAYYSRATLLNKMGRHDAAAEDMQMVAHLTELNVESHANENNVWRSRQLQVEDAIESEMHR